MTAPSLQPEPDTFVSKPGTRILAIIAASLSLAVGLAAIKFAVMGPNHQNLPATGMTIFLSCAWLVLSIPIAFQTPRSNFLPFISVAVATIFLPITAIPLGAVGFISAFAHPPRADAEEEDPGTLKGMAIFAALLNGIIDTIRGSENRQSRLIQDAVLSLNENLDNSIRPILSDNLMQHLIALAMPFLITMIGFSLGRLAKKIHLAIETGRKTARATLNNSLQASNSINLKTIDSEALLGSTLTERSTSSQNIAVNRPTVNGTESENAEAVASTHRKTQKAEMALAPFPPSAHLDIQGHPVENPQSPTMEHSDQNDSSEQSLGRQLIDSDTFRANYGEPTKQVVHRDSIAELVDALVAAPNHTLRNLDAALILKVNKARLNGPLSHIKRYLNFDQYEVISSGDEVRLDLQLLCDHFDVK